MKRTTESNLFIQLRSLYPTLTRIEKKIADYVMDNASEIVFETISDFAEKCDVSETSIVRFCRSIGTSGFQEFKLILARVTAASQSLAHQSDEENAGGLRALLKTVSDEHGQLQRNSFQILDYGAIETSIYKLKNARKIDVYGLGDNRFSAMEAAYKWKRIGLPAEPVTDPEIQLAAASMLTSSDVAVGISSEGAADGTFHALEAAKKAGASTICLTNHALSPVAKSALIVLLTASAAEAHHHSFKSNIAQLFMLDMIHAALCSAILINEN